MSMIGHYRRITTDELTDLQDDPTAIIDFLYGQGAKGSPLESRRFKMQ